MKLKTLIRTLLFFGLALVIMFGVLTMKVERTPVDNLEETTLKVTFEGEFEINSESGAATAETGAKTAEPVLSWATITTLNYPEASDHLEVIDFGASEPYSKGIDGLGNSYVTLNFSNPQIGANKYKIWSTVKVKRIEISQISQSTEIIPPEFMNADAMVQSDAPEIKALADQIIAEAKPETQLEKVQAVAGWVNKNIVYDSSIEKQSNTALWTLQNKRGVCVEISHLTEALLRSLGIPARHVYGVAPFNFPEGWQEHTWVEAYVGRWVPIDPTWNELEFLDPAHVTFARVANQKSVEEKVNVAGRNIAMGNMILPKMTVEIIEEKRGKEPIEVHVFGKKIKIR